MSISQLPRELWLEISSYTNTFQQANLVLALLGTRQMHFDPLSLLNIVWRYNT